MLRGNVLEFRAMVLLQPSLDRTVDKARPRCLLDIDVDELPFPQEQKFRQQQLAKWLYAKSVLSIDDMSDLSKDWREQLKTEFYVSPFVSFERFPSRDHSVRYLFHLHDGKQTEAVYMPYQGRKTVCISSMVGCPAACAFCATGAYGFGRNLTSGEIVGQITAIAALEGISALDIRNVVLMGMGEALLNYDNALAAVRRMIDARALDMSPRRITLSTVGLPKHIRRLADEGLNLVLALSLHAPDEETRQTIIPSAHAHSIADIMDALGYWQERLNRRISIEYTMLHSINDSLDQAEQLARVLRGLKAHVNLIPFNSWPGSDYVSSSPRRIERFKRALEHHKLEVSVRFSRGQDAGAACGQLSLQHTEY